jgi:uncharacterized protein YecE (DUF72 family)
MGARRGHIRIGISGWLYRGWRGSFYPKGLRQKDELTYAAGRFDTIEINGTFYSLKRPEAFARWREMTPDGFVFAVKGSRFITHMKKLRDVDTALANFFASGVLALREKLGPFLWQLPANFAFDAERVERFLSLLKTDRRRKLRHAIEIRHPDFLDPAFIALLRQQNVALVFADAAGWPYTEDVTADFVYIRLHGSEERYASGYDEWALGRWAKRIERWAAGGAPSDAKLVERRPPRRRKTRDVYVYFDNDAKVRAPFDAQDLRERLAR